MGKTNFSSLKWLVLSDSVIIISTMMIFCTPWVYKNVSNYILVKDSYWTCAMKYLMKSKSFWIQWKSYVIFKSFILAYDSRVCWSSVDFKLFKKRKGLGGKESTCQCGRCWSCRFDPWAGKISLRRKWLFTLVFSPGESHGLRSLVGYSPWGSQSGTGLSDWDCAQEKSSLYIQKMEY